MIASVLCVCVGASLGALVRRVLAWALEHAGLQIGQALELRAEGGRLVLEPAAESLDDLIARITPAGFHPASGRRAGRASSCIVLSPATYNNKTSLMLCCPITNQVKGYPFEVPVVPGGGTNVSGVVLADQARCLDWAQRNAAKIGFVTAQCALDVSARIKALLP